MRGDRLPKHERPPREGLRFLRRAFGSVLLITLLTAAATATAALLKIKDRDHPAQGRAAAASRRRRAPPTSPSRASRRRS